MQFRLQLILFGQTCEVGFIQSIIMLPSRYSVSFLYFITIFVSYHGARILGVFPTPSLSHQIVFRTLTQELARRGHEVVILSPNPAFPDGHAPPNIRELKLHGVSYVNIIEEWNKVESDNGATILSKVKNRRKIRNSVFRILNMMFGQLILTLEFQEIIKGNTHFDLILTEALIRPALVLSHVFRAPVIQISSFGAVPPNLQAIGAFCHPILFAEHIQKRIYNLTLWEKIYNIYDDIELRYSRWRLEESENKMIQKHFGPYVPTVSELVKNVDLLFLNVDPMWDDNRPVPPGVIYLGRIHQAMPQKELPKDLKYYMDTSEHGVIYMSFGSNIKSSDLPLNYIETFTQVFSNLPYDVLWKWDSDDLQGQPANVKILKWLPQSDLLKHPKIRLFITQGGLQSTDEAIWSGVPLLVIPITADQWYNAEKIVRHGIGVQLNIESVTKETLNESINSIITDDRYRSNIRRLDNLMRDRPDTPLERAVWWTEYVIRHRGAKHLRSAAADVTWTKYLMLDVVIPIVTLVLLVLTHAILLIRYCCDLFRRRSQFKSKTN